MRDSEIKTIDLSECIGMIHSVAKRYIKDEKQKNKIALLCVELHDKLREKKPNTVKIISEINKLANIVSKELKITD